MKIIMGLLFAVIFFVLAATAFALLAPIVFKGADFEKLGEAVGPLILLVAGPVGFRFGYMKRKKKETRNQSQQDVHDVFA